MSSTAPQRPVKTASEVRNAALSFVGKLDTGELLTGVPTVTVSPAGPTISTIARNSAIVTINGVSVPIDQAVTWRVSGGTVGVTYTFTVTCGTDGGQTLIGYAKLIVQDS